VADLDVAIDPSRSLTERVMAGSRVVTGSPAVVVESLSTAPGRRAANNLGERLHQVSTATSFEDLNFAMLEATGDAVAAFNSFGALAAPFAPKLATASRTLPGAPRAPVRSSQPVDAPALAVNSSHGVYFFGEDVFPFIDRPEATLGRSGRAHFFSPAEDVAGVRSVGDAARASGGAPSIEKAYLSEGRGFGVSFPLDDLAPRVPTAVDARGFAHYFGEGRTALRTAEPNAGYLLNDVRELMVPGGGPMPAGSTLFEIGPDGTRIPKRRF
jgi:hypothetical protein